MRSIGGVERPDILEAGMRHLTISLWVCAALAGGAMAQEAAPGVAPGAAAAAEDWEQLRAQARELRQKAKQMRGDAQALHDATAKACWEKFLVSGCQQDAKVELRKAEREARQVDLEALAVEKRVAAHERELQRAKKLERQRQREAKAARKAEQLRSEDARRQAGGAAPAAPGR